MKLPDALAGWEPYLDLFPREVGLALLPLVRRLAAGIGPLQSENTLGMGEPDGFDGLHRAGNYERLLLSEWLLAEEAPDEFLRRAAMGEHAFLRLARREPSRARISLALFDAGPNQMGAPRIAQLAALLVLARRAEAAGADFRWAIIQDRESDYSRGTDAGAVWRFLQARTATEVSPWAIGWWLRELEPEDYKNVWVVGGRRLATLPDMEEFCRLEVTDPLQESEDRLEVAIRLPGRSPKQLDLPLPTSAESARLLRDPFGAVTREAVRSSDISLAPTSNLVFTAGGGRLVARCRGGVVIYHVPNSARAGVGKPQVVMVPEGWTCVAVGRMRKTLLYALLDDSGSRLRLQRIGGKSERMLNREFEVALPHPWVPGGSENEALDLGEIAIDPHSPAAQPVLFIRIGSNVILAYPYAPPYDEASKLAAVLREGVTALSPERRNVRYLCSDRLSNLLFTARDDGAQEPIRLGAALPNSASFLGWRPNYLDPSGQWTAALAVSTNEWRLLGGNGLDQRLSAPDGTEVVGVMGELQAGMQPGLVVLNKDRRRLSMVGARWSHELPAAADEIRHVTVSTAGPIIAYSTVSGDVVVYRCDQKSVVLRLLAAREAEA